MVAQTLALDRPQLPRISVVDGSLPSDYLYGLVDSAHPWAVVPDPFDPERLAQVVRDALERLLAGNAEAAQAQRDLEARRTTGSTVLLP